MSHRIERINSLLKEVISDVINKEVRNPHLPKFISIIEVKVTKDLHLAKVYISVLGSKEEKKKAVEVLNSAAGFIAVSASKKIEMRYFPVLTFFLDTALEKQIHMDQLINKVQSERKSREPSESEAGSQDE